MGTRPVVRSRPVIGAIALVAVLVGCGDDGDSGPTASGPEGEVQETILTYLLEGDCDVMTDDFLDEQVVGVGDTWDEQCEVFENTFVEKQYSADDVKFSDVEVTGSRATAVVGDDFSNIESTYTLVEVGGQWRIESAELT